MALQFSEEHRKILSNKECPRCGTKLITTWNTKVKYFREDGTEIMVLSSSPLNIMSLVNPLNLVDTFKDVMHIGFRHPDEFYTAGCSQCNYIGVSH